MSNLNRTLCPAVKGAAPLDPAVLGPRLNQPHWCPATRPTHIPLSRSAWMGFGCQTPVTINSCQLGKACFSNGVGSGSPHRGETVWGPRGGQRQQGGQGAEGREHPPHLSPRPQEGLQQGRGKLLGWGGFSTPRGLGQAPRVEARVGSPRGSAQRVMSACRPTVPRVDAGPRLPAPCPLQTPPAQPEVDGPKTLREEPQKGQRSDGSLLQAPQRLHEARGEAPLQAAALTSLQPTGHPGPHSHPALGLGPHPHAHRGRAPGASGNRRSDAGLGGLPSCGTEAATAQGLNQSGSRTSSGRGQAVSPEIHGLEGGAGRPR